MGKREHLLCTFCTCTINKAVINNMSSVSFISSSRFVAIVKYKIQYIPDNVTLTNSNALLYLHGCPLHTSGALINTLHRVSFEKLHGWLLG